MAEKELLIYLAGPFFNDNSREVLIAMLRILEEEGLKVFAPMRDGVMCPKDADKATRQAVFQMDVQEIDKAQLVVALLDYPMPNAEQLMLMKTQGNEHLELDRIAFPDSGTVFEMGYAYCSKTPIIGFARTPTGFNLMLSESLISFCRSFKSLREVCRAFKNNKSVHPDPDGGQQPLLEK